MLEHLSFQCCCYTVPRQLARAARRLILRLNRLRAHAYNPPICRVCAPYNTDMSFSPSYLYCWTITTHV